MPSPDRDYILEMAPAVVQVIPAGELFYVVAKYPCDLGILQGLLGDVCGGVFVLAARSWKRTTRLGCRGYGREFCWYVANPPTVSRTSLAGCTGRSTSVALHARS